MRRPLGKFRVWLILFTFICVGKSATGIPPIKCIEGILASAFVDSLASPTLVGKIRLRPTVGETEIAVYRAVAPDDGASIYFLGEERLVAPEPPGRLDIYQFPYGPIIIRALPCGGTICINALTITGQPWKFPPNVAGESKYERDQAKLSMEVVRTMASDMGFQGPLAFLNADLEALVRYAVETP